MCVCVCEQTEGDVLAGSFQTQAASAISQLMIFNSKNEFGSQKQGTQTQTRRHTKPVRRPFQSTLAWNVTAAALYILQHRVFEKREDKKWDIWRLVQEISGAAKVSILGLCAGVGAERSSVHSIHPNCRLQPVHTDIDEAVTMLLLFCPWRYQNEGPKGTVIALSLQCVFYYSWAIKVCGSSLTAKRMCNTHVKLWWADDELYYLPVEIFLFLLCDVSSASRGQI